MPVQTIDDLILRSYKTAVDKGWWDTERNFPEQLALIHSEISEVLEEYREYGLENVEKISYFKGKPVGIAIEFADILIRIFDICGKYAVPLEDALRIKMDFNEKREYRHGGKKA